MPLFATKACRDLILASKKVSFAQFRSWLSSRWAFQSCEQVHTGSAPHGGGAPELLGSFTTKPLVPPAPHANPTPSSLAGRMPAAAGGGIPAAPS